MTGNGAMDNGDKSCSGCHWGELPFSTEPCASCRPLGLCDNGNAFWAEHGSLKAYIAESLCKDRTP
jgi:hypothetical protein